MTASPVTDGLVTAWNPGKPGSERERCIVHAACRKVRQQKGSKDGIGGKGSRGVSEVYVEPPGWEAFV